MERDGWIVDVANGRQAVDPRGKKVFWRLVDADHERVILDYRYHKGMFAIYRVRVALGEKAVVEG